MSLADRVRHPGWWAACVLALALAPRADGADPARTAANVPVEVEFTAQRDHPDPFNTVTLDVVFKSPGGKAARVPAFWAGGKSWKVRYASGEVGAHAYRAESGDPADPGLHGVEGRVEVGPYEGDNPLYRHGPIRVAGDRRHFEHADGTPFFWLGDTWWMGLCDRLKWPDEVARLTADRKAKGFNVVQLVAGLYPDMHPFDPRGATDGGFPWEPDYARIRPEFFDAVDLRLRHLVDAGISPCVVGMWGYFLPWMGEAHARQHWRYLIARYGAMPVTWCVAGEANLPWYLAKGFPYDDREVVHGWTRVIRYVRETDPFHRPVTIHPTAINQYTARHATDDPALLDFDMLQTPHGRREATPITLKAARDSYAAEPVMPVVDGEAAFERLSDQLPTEWTRAMFWICMTSGTAGHTYGANGIWQCNRRGQPHGNSPTGGNYGVIPWDEAMDLPGSTQVGAGKRFLERFPWQRLAPHPEWVAWDGADSARGPEPGRWIWFPEGDATKDAPVAARYFRREFDLPPGASIRRARLLVGADDRYTAWVNGREVGAGGGWAGQESIDVAAAIRPGRNVLAIRAENMPAPVQLNPAGLVAALEVEPENGPVVRVATDKSWRSSRTEVPGWREPGYDEAPWSAAHELGPMGINPWGPIVPREGIPPLCLGQPDGPRVCYMLDARPVLLRGLMPAQAYKVMEFDPVAGTTREAAELKADASGQARRAAPGHGHDWVLALVPAPAE